MSRTSLASQIPNHPEKCKGVSGPNYTTDQCRLCWLALYDRNYRRHWRIAKEPEKAPVVPEQQYPCIHRGTEPLTIPGCGFCGSGPPARMCNHPQIQSRCVITGPETLLANARAKGYRICDECGYREQESDMEMLPSRFRALLDQSPDCLPQGWEDWKVTKVVYREYFQELCKAQVKPPKNISGRGIVIGAGGETYFKNAWCVANHLRKHGCDLPIQFWYLGYEEMDPVMLSAANAIGIDCVDATKVAVKPRILGGWELKPFSVIHCPFEEVLYLDADSLPAKNPEYLFDIPEYLDFGAIFWPDLPPARQKEWIPASVWEQWGLLPDSGPDLESGQFVVNKSRCWHELLVTMWLNEHSDWVYKTVYGDKSTYNLAWAGCGTTYALPTKPAGWQRPIIFQYDLAGDLVFQHCCQGKQHLAEGLPIKNLNNYEWAIEAKKELERYWNGHIYAQETDLSLGKFEVHVEKTVEIPINKLTKMPVDPKVISLELTKKGSVLGSTLGFQEWHLKSENELYFISKGRVFYAFDRNPDTGEWWERTYGFRGILKG